MILGKPYESRAHFTIACRTTVVPSIDSSRPRRIDRGPAVQGSFIYPDGITARCGRAPVFSNGSTMNRQRIFRFGLMIWQTGGLSPEQLLRIVKSKRRYSPHFRAAALRRLVLEAPLSVTCGKPFAERRRRVRQHYSV